MLFNAKTLKGIASGEVTCAFRRWRRPTVRAGGRLRTRVGELAIESVDPLDLSDPAAIGEEDARRSGAADAAAVRAQLAEREGTAYLIRFRLAGADSRTALRETVPDDGEMDEIVGRLARWDAGRIGPWTRATLEAIAAEPGTRAPDLAARFGRETQPFKRDVRRLKELGLTESLAVGYRISPRGAAVLDRLRSN